MARLTMAEKLQKQLDEIRENCRHTKGQLILVRAIENGLFIGAYCRKCAKEIRLDPCVYCGKCLAKTMRRGDNEENIMNNSTHTEYTCKECGSEHIHSELMY